MTTSSERHQRSGTYVAPQRLFIANHSLVAVCFGIAILFAMLGSAAEIHPDQALTAVGNWLRSAQHRPLATPLARNGDAVQSIRDEQGRALCHIVALQGGGFVITGGDDGVVPIVAFAARGAFPSSRNHHLRAILFKDLPQRLAWADRHRANPTTRQDTSAPDYASQWQQLLKPNPKTRNGIEQPDDLRVAPLVQSTWGQDFIYSDSWEKINIYNYYTPNNYVTGCVATVGAQLMRYHEYPTKPVAALTNKCAVDGQPRYLTMKGGTYDWGNMPLKPDAAITDSQRQAIGKLLFDLAVSVEMSFWGDGSLSSMYDLRIQLCDTFHFANAKYFLCWDDGLSVSSTTHFEDMLLTNLDAGYPAVLGINGSQGGHAVVGDGYGFHNGYLYVHLNMGWDGYGDSWYHLPYVETDQVGFTVFDELIFNAFPDFVGELISGRATDLTGQPLAGVAVTAQNVATQTIVAETTTNDRGIYALKIPAPAAAQKLYRIRAVFRGAESIKEVDAVVTSNNYNVIDTAAHDYRVKIGSRWGVDLELDPLPFIYSVENNAVSITGYVGEPTVMLIPDTIEGLPVVAIAAEAFRDLNTLTSVVLADSVVSIGRAAFAGCLNLQRVSFGRGVTSIGEGVVQNCPALANIVVPPENNAFVTDAAGALYSHDFSALYHYPPARVGSYAVPADVTIIHPYAFAGCANLQQLTLPESLQEIGAEAFRSCASLTALTVPVSLNRIGTNAFADSTIMEFVFVGQPPVLGATPFPPGATIRYYQTNAAWVGLDTFGGCAVEMIPVFYTVSFLLGDKGRTEEGQLLTQLVQHGTAAAAPTVATDSPWAFAGWDADVTTIIGDMTIQARYSYSRDVALSAGWQTIGLDFIPDENCGAALANQNLTFFDPVQKVFTRQVGFAAGRAYWLFRPEPGTITLSGEIIATPPLPTARGWHFVAVGANYSALPGDIAVAWQWRNGRYRRAYQLVLGEAYWLYCPGTER